MPMKPSARKPAPAKAEPVRVAFVGQIKQVKTMTDAVGDKVGSITIGFRPDGSTVADLDAIHNPDSEVYVVIVERGDE